MITEDYVSFETAKLLKEKGFEERIRSWYDNNGVFHEEGCRMSNSDCLPPTVMAPTLQMVMKWLREEKGIAAVPILSSVLDNEKFLWDIEITVAKTNENYHQGWIYESYEQAVEAAIKYSLENLI